MSKKKISQAPNRPPASATATPTPPEGGAAGGFSFFDHAWLPVLVILGATAAVYAGSLGNDFVPFDDDKSIWYNKIIKNPSLAGILGGQSLGMYAPVTILFYTVVYQIFGENAGAFHAAGLFLHLINAVLVYRLFLRVQDRTWAAFFIALMFGLHPIMVEPVSWVSGLSTPLYAVFYLGSLHLFWSFLEGKGQRFFWLAWLVFVLSGLSKSAAATLPMVLVALDWWRNGKLTLQTVWNKWPFWLVSAMLIGYTFVTRSAEGHNFDVTKAYTLVDRVFMISQTIFFYPFKMLLPLGFSISYPFPKSGGVWRSDYYMALPALMFVLWWVYRNINRQREAVLAIALYLFPLALMLPVVTVGSFEMRSDRYVYIAGLGIFLLLMLVAEKISAPALRYGLLGLICAFFGFQTLKQTHVWENGTTLFKNCVDKTPDVALCQCNLGYSELLAKRFDSSIDHYSKTLELDKTYVEAYNGRGQAYLNLSTPKINEALADFSHAIDAGIVTPKLFFNRGKCLALTNRYEEAIPDFSKSLELESKSFETWYFRAFCHEKTGKLDLALADYSKAIDINPDYVEALVNRGLIYFNRQQYAESIADNTAAINRAATGLQTMILVNRANGYLKIGQLNLALADANNALTINQNYGRAYQTRAAVYMQMGQPDKAKADLQRVK